MKRGVIYIVLCIALIQTVSAFELTDIRGYVNNDRVSSVDSDGGGEFKVIPKDTVDVITEINNEQNLTLNVKLRGTIEGIDNGNDIVEEQVYYTIPAVDSKSKLLTFSIPAAATAKNYNLKLRITYNYNGTEVIVDKSYDLVVKDSDSTLDISTSFKNLTDTCQSMVGTINSCFGYINQSTALQSTLATCSTEKGAIQENADTCTASLNTCYTDKTDIQNINQQLTTQVSTMILLSECNNITATKVKQSEDSKNQFLMFIVGGAGAFWFYTNNKKKGSTVSDSYYYEKK